MWGNNKNSSITDQPSPSNRKEKIPQLPPHDMETFELCSNKCLKNGVTDVPTLMEKSCFNRCVIKFTEALKFTADQIRYQNHDIKKTNEHQRMQMEGIDNQGFLDKMYGIYN